jgi:hypothetical protein
MWQAAGRRVHKNNVSSTLPLFAESPVSRGLIEKSHVSWKSIQGIGVSLFHAAGPLVALVTGAHPTLSMLRCTGLRNVAPATVAQSAAGSLCGADVIP